MITLDLCLEMVLPGVSLADKVRRAADAGFKAVEFWFSDFDCDIGAYADRDLTEVRKACDATGVVINNIVLNSPDGGIGGSLLKPSDHAGYLKRFDGLLPVLKQLNVDRMITCSGNTLPDVPEADQFKNAVEVLKRVADAAARNKVTLVLEPLNSLVDHAGYFVDSFQRGLDLINAVGSPNLKVLYDVYHMQIMEGNVIATITRNIKQIGHFHSAGVPGRHELDEGELNYPRILKAIHEAGYDGCFGLEYSPAMKEHGASMKRQHEYLASAGGFVH